MAKIDLTSQEWCDLIFEGRNKDYGAYKMRARAARRLNFSVVLVIVIAAVGFSIPRLITMVTPEKAVGRARSEAGRSAEGTARGSSASRPEELHQVYGTCHQEG